MVSRKIKRATSPRPVQAGRQRGAPAIPQPHFEVTPERLTHAANDTAIVKANIDKAGERPLLTRRFSDSQFDRLHRAKHITDAQWAAGVWYRERYETAGIGGRVTANYNPAGGGGECAYGMATTLLQANARKLWRQAREKIEPQMLKLVEDMVLHDIAPTFINGQARARYAGNIGKALNNMAQWLNLPC